jgi:D-glycero-D-manno-heptose 1,7-bisphosphate phosphatase
MSASASPGREPSASPSREAVFLDRDGTLITELGYLADPEAIEFHRGAARAVARLNEAGLAVVLFTNQSGIARGLFTEETLAQIHERLAVMLAEEDALLDLVLYSPYHPTIGDARYRRVTDCRKPGGGMILEARDRLGLDLDRSWVVGDSERDLEAGRRAGVGELVLVRTGKGRDVEAAASAEQLATWRITDHLEAAVDLILAGRAD